jgi:multidrug resistance protein, MATE family
MFQPFSAGEAAAGPARGWFSREASATFALSWPLVLANLASSLMTTTDIMMLGWLSPKALAAGALAYNLFLPLFLFGIGMMSAASPIAASLVGANAADIHGPRRAAHQAFLSTIILLAPMWAILWNARRILVAFGENPELAAQAGVYLHGYAWCLAPALLFFAARSVFAALHRTAPTLIAGLLGVAINALLNYLLIFGKFGFPAWGIFGSGIATSLAQLAMLGMLVAYSLTDPLLRRHRLFSGLWRWHGPSFAQLWRIGAPTGVMIGVEIAIFSSTVLLMGLIGDAALEAHAMVFQIASLAFMVPLGVGQAATVRVGHAFGARNALGVSRAGWTALWMVLAFMSASAMTMLLFPRLLLSGFIDVSVPANAQVVGIALSFIHIAALFQIFDGAQVVGAGMLRGLHDARTPMLIAFFGYWVVGAPIGLYLAFRTPLSGLGLWIGLAVGLAFVAVLLLMRWRQKERAGFFSAPAAAGKA